MMKVVFILFLTLGVAAAAACSSADAPAPNPDDSCFVAYAPNFNGFQSWSSYTYDAGTQGAPTSFVVSHVSGVRTEYINELPPAGATEFPVGTMIVKEIAANDPTNHQTFAMVKRGCDYNAAGAKNWEWMELVDALPGATILWRGAQPPPGEMYAADGAACNTCHTGCNDNDSVCSPMIRLAAH